MTRLSSMTFQQAQEVISRGAVALWPIGSTEAHGPHLPLDTDVVIAEQACLRSVTALTERTGKAAVVLPPLSFTITDFAAPFSGTINLPRETTLPYVRDVLIAAAAQGFSAVCMVNAHLEPAHRFMLRDAVKAARPQARCPVGLADPADRRWSSTLTEEFSSGSCHAGQYETSLILAANEGRVRTDLQSELTSNPVPLVERIKGGAKDFVQAGAPDAYCGDPAAATIEEGEQSYAQLVEIICSVTAELLEEPHES